MENTGFLIFVVLALVFVTTGLLVASQFFASPKKVLEQIFPDQRSKIDLFGPPNQVQSDALIIYVCSRAFALSFLGLVVLWIWRHFTRGA